MGDKTDAATQKAVTSEKLDTPADPSEGGNPPDTAPAQPVDQAAQKEAGRDRAEGGGYT